MEEVSNASFKFIVKFFGKFSAASITLKLIVNKHLVFDNKRKNTAKRLN